MRTQKALKNIISSLVLQLIVIIYGFIVPKIIITTYGSTVNGLVSSIAQFLSYIALLDSGFTAVVKTKLYKPIACNDKSEITKILKAADIFFKRIAYIFIGYIIVVSILYPFITNTPISYASTVILIIIISISMFSEYYFGMTYRIFLESNQQNYIISNIQIITYVLNIIVIIFLAKIRTTIHILKLFTGIIFILRPLLQNFYVKKKYNISFKNESGKYLLKNKWDGLAQHIASVIHGNTDITILTIFSTFEEVSVYSVYNIVIVGIKKIIQSFTSGIDASFGDMLVKGESENLKKKFDLYELIYNTISVIIFSCTLILISPFIKLYTMGINDVNYVRYIFGYLIVVSEYIWAIRLPYSSIILAAGHFKETRKGAWIECTINILISLILVINYGIIGVIIGTIVAMTIRTIEFVLYSNKNILKRNCVKSFIRILIVIIETLLIIAICRKIKLLEYSSYLNWGINALLIVIISIVITFLFNFIVYKSDLIEVINYVKKNIRRNDI